MSQAIILEINKMLLREAYAFSMVKQHYNGPNGRKTRIGKISGNKKMQYFLNTCKIPAYIKAIIAKDLGPFSSILYALKSQSELAIANQFRCLW